MKKFIRGGNPEIIAAVALALVICTTIGYLAGKGRIHPGNVAMEAVNNQNVRDDVDGVTVGGNKLRDSQTIIDNAASAQNLTNLVAALRSSGASETLAGSGPFTLFAPTNDAFGTLDGGIEKLLKPENKELLSRTTSYVIVQGAYTSAELKEVATKGQQLTTLNQQKITPLLDNDELKLQDAAGNKVAIESSDAVSSNGVLFAISGVLHPDKSK